MAETSPCPPLEVLRRRVVVFPHGPLPSPAELLDAESLLPPEAVSPRWSPFRYALESALREPHLVQALWVTGRGRQLDVWLPRGESYAVDATLRAAGLLGYPAYDVEDHELQCQVALDAPLPLSELLGRVTASDPTSLVVEDPMRPRVFIQVWPTDPDETSLLEVSGPTDVSRTATARLALLGFRRPDPARGARFPFRFVSLGGRDERLAVASLVLQTFSEVLDLPIGDRVVARLLIQG